ncbi:MAG TPA: hypothetical protein PLD20_03730 [Blastocatellia bacterium]|nr:hypothetical protein [Blastocatellia bacterium]HMV86984.1 hypothetical protein [Blastocatellia bacterium]HMY75326.1 hypothetical protein [Blastocatellia bacterium]HMZ17014.1 hypothetical protein [Blastocatellia bacterium]HNG33016.1 hypothetical protein [Blastocatellia bacterium]
MKQPDNAMIANQFGVSTDADANALADLNVQHAEAIKGGPGLFVKRRGSSPVATDDVVVDGKIITAELFD